MADNATNEVPDIDLSAELSKRFKELPKVVRDAITSADVEKQLRALADTHKLHLDDWEALENEVMLTLLGFQSPADLSANIRTSLEVPQATADALAADISRIVFEPIRAQLERELGKPEAPAVVQTPVQAVREQILERAKSAPIIPATPPPPPNEAKVPRAPVSESYKAGQTSASRKSIHDDPYREPPA